MRRTRRKRKNGARCAALLAGLILAALSWAAPALAAGAGEAPYALIAGTVFREPGFALPGAEVVLGVKVAPEKGKRPKPQKVLSDRRGEFTFRVPAAKARYLLTVKANGYGGEEKTVDISTDERVDVYFNLKPSAQ